MRRSRQREEQAVATTRRLIRVLWVLGLVPLLVVLAAGLQSSRTETWLEQVGRMTLPDGIYQLQDGHDRRGDHVAALARDRTIHVLQLTNGRLTSQKLAYPWPERDGFRVRLALADATNDDLVDLLLMRYPIDETDTTVSQPISEAWECAIFRQERDRFVQDRLVERTPVMKLDEDTASLSAFGEQLRLATVSNGQQQMTQVYSAESERAIALLAGEPYSIRDMDEDGNQDLLTSEEQFEGDQPGENVFRLYLFRHDRIHEVWSGTFQNVDIWRAPRRYTLLADLDSDGLCEIVVTEPFSGELKVFGIDPAKLVG